MDKEIKKMSVKEFREQGYLQEINRLFLHPLGLALEVNLNEDGSEAFGEVWDYRDDPEGMIYGEDIIDLEKALRIRKEELSKQSIRYARFGWIIQPPFPEGR
jgi:hypothetical protein